MRYFIKVLRFLFRTLTFFYNYFYNRILICFSNSYFESFPEIRGRITKKGKGKLMLGRDVKINSSLYVNPVGIMSESLFYVTENASIIIGNNVGISNSLLYATKNITIKDDVMIGGGCQILDTDFHSILYINRILQSDNNILSKPIVIEKGAFIGASVIILKGVAIGERSVVAAGSVVTKSIPDNEVWAGNPARFIRKLER